MFKKIISASLMILISSSSFAKHPEGHSNGSQSTTGNPTGSTTGGESK